MNISYNIYVKMGRVGLQYSDMEIKEREAIIDALLRYCELDTLAMVMIYEH